ncbi:MAG TPA: ABC transporter permease [Terracidiphilus sp.]|jgi:putative ABC transport system permease protein
MQTLFQDLRYAVRQLRKSPGFTLAAVLTLSIGIGANTALFSNMDAVVLHPLAVPQLDRVVTIAEQSRQSGAGYLQVALANYADWVRQSRSFEQLAVLTSGDMSLTGAGDAAHVRAAQNSANFFNVLRVQPLLGRVFADSECRPGRDAVAVLNYGFWQRQFAGDPAILGRKVELDQRTFTVVGVLPKTMQYPSEVDIFLPFAPTPQQLENRIAHNYLVIGRLHDGVTAGQAQAEMRIIGERLAAAYPATNLGQSAKVEPLLDGINGDLTPLYYRMVMGATLFVLLVVCANVANLQFARGIARRPEIAMRTALGASRWRVMRQLLTENILLGLIGAAGGLLFAMVDLRLTLIAMPDRVARYLAGWSNISLNGRALAFSLLLAVGAGAAAGVLPGIEALRINLLTQLKAGSRGNIGSGTGHRLRSIFAVSQISLAVALVIGAALMAKGMSSLLHLADTYKPEKTLTFHVKLPEARYDTAEKQATWYANSLERLRALPGVKNAAVTTALPYGDTEWTQDFEIEHRPVVPGKFQSGLRVPVSEGYFAGLGIPIVAGRAFSKNDSLNTVPAAIVSRRFAAQYFPDQNPMGHRVRLGIDTPGHPRLWFTIVGVAEDASYSIWNPTPRVAVYTDVAQDPPTGVTYALATDGNPLALSVSARKALAAIDPGLPLDTVETYQQVLHDSLTGLMYATVLLLVDAGIALLLAAIGIFGVMANLVGERTREIGVRLAMGARREDVLGMILRRATWLTGTGIIFGLAMAFGLAHLTANLLRGVRPDDPAVFGGITAVIAGIALFASWIPARRASRIDPMVALHDE